MYKLGPERMQICSSFLLTSTALLLCLSVVVESDEVQSLIDVFSAHDLARIRNLLLASEPYDDVSVPCGALRGLKALGVTDKTDAFKKNACGFSWSHLDTSNLLSLFHISSIAVDSSCVPKFLEKKSEIETFLAQSMEGDLTMESLYHITSIKTNLGLSINSETILSSIMTIIDNEETIYNSALAFLTAAQLDNIDLSGVFELIEDVVAQADETPSSLFYDTLETTSTVISGIFALATRVGEAPSITPEQATKFGNYLLSNAFTTNVTTLGHLLTAASALNNNEYVVPCSLLLSSSGYVSKTTPNIQVRLATILGSPPPTEFSITLETITDQEGRETSPKKQLKAERGSFSYDLFKEVTDPGIYALTFSSKAAGKSLIVQLSDAQVQVTVSFEVTVGSAQLMLVDREHGTAAKTVSLEYPNSSKETLEADQHSKLVMKFTLLNRDTRKAVRVHQAFVRLVLGIHEIFFVATADKNTLQYTFELDMATAAVDFAGLSGSYSIALIIGDFALENSFSWDIGTVNLAFPGKSTDSAQEEDYTYKPKPPIEHMFRPDEKLPPKVISSTFTVLVLSPLAILLVLWVAIGVNVSGFTTGGIWALIFHIGLAGIFVVYYLFWVQLNMFDTLKFLTLISIPTFLAGNRMLKRIAQANKEST